MLNVETQKLSKAPVYESRFVWNSFSAGSHQSTYGTQCPVQSLVLRSYDDQLTENLFPWNPRQCITDNVKRPCAIIFHSGVSVYAGELRFKRYSSGQLG